jgi:nucleoside-diphosphate-sugar epimerase
MRITLDHPGVYNVGRDDRAVPMRRVAEIACLLTGAPLSLIEEVDPPARQTVVKRLATQKLKRLGWMPEVELESGMAMTLKWLEGLEEQAA